MLEIKDITFVAEGERKILDGISLTIPDGKLICLTGPNGGGKTTLAKVIAGVKTQTGGQILLNGQDISGLDPTERAKAGVAFAFQQPVRFKGISIRKLLSIAAGRALTDEELKAALENVGMVGLVRLRQERHGKQHHIPMAREPAGKGQRRSHVACR